MKKNIVIILILSILGGLLGGCWSKRELNELAIASAIGIDRDANGYLLTVQIINPGEIAGQKATGQSSPILTYRTSGKSIFEALRRLSVETPRKVYLSHLRVVVLGEELARKGIADVLDFLARDHELRTDFYILIAKGTKADTVLRTLTALEDIPANKIFSSLETSEKAWAATHGVQLDELLNNIISKGINPVATGILVTGNTAVGMNLENRQNAKLPSLLKINGLAGFKEDKLVGWLDEEESIGYSAITSGIKSSVTSLEMPEGGTLTVEVMKVEAKIKPIIDDDGPRIEIELRSEGNVGEVQCDIDLAKPESILQIENLWNEKSEERISKVIKAAQEELKSDIFGFGEAFHRKYPREWKDLQANWDEAFIDLPVNLKIKGKIRHTGTITNLIQKEEE